MNMDLQNKCTQLAENYRIMRQGNLFEYQAIIAAGAALYLEQGRAVDPDRIRECKKVLSRKKGIFSNFRGISSYVIRCKLALAPDPEVYLQNLDTVYKGLKSFFSGEQVVLAAMVIVDTVSPDGYPAAVEKTKSLYKEVRKTHPWLTSEDDMPFVALMAVQGTDKADIYQEAEENYAILKRDLKASNESRQMLSHILSFCEGTPEEKCGRIVAIAEGLKNAKHRLGRDRYISILGVLASSRLSTDEIVSMICEADDCLKQHKPFRGIFGTGSQTRRMFAVQMVDASLREKGGSAVAGAVNVSSTISTSIEVTIITLLMLYAIIASSTAHSAAQSHS